MNETWEPMHTKILFFVLLVALLGTVPVVGAMVFILWVVGQVVRA